MPEPLELSTDLEETPVEAYWRIELPLFASLWKDLDEQQRHGAMRSLGELMSRAHSAGASAGRTLTLMYVTPTFSSAYDGCGHGTSVDGGRFPWVHGGVNAGCTGPHTTSAAAVSTAGCTIVGEPSRSRRRGQP